jgi:hypothetical protein
MRPLKFSGNYAGGYTAYQKNAGNLCIGYRGSPAFLFLRWRKVLYEGNCIERFPQTRIKP